MSLSTMYIIAVFIAPTALGVFLLTFANIDGLRSTADRSQRPAADQQLARYLPSLATGGETKGPGLGSLFHRAATQ